MKNMHFLTILSSVFLLSCGTDTRDCSKDRVEGIDNRPVMPYDSTDKDQIRNPFDYRLKSGKSGEKAIESYEKIEEGAKKGYQAIEDAAVGTYKKIEDWFVDKFLEEIPEK